jgi:hypothetical protein
MENTKKTKINKFKTKLPDKSAFTIETDFDFPKLHTLCIASGKRGGGKSVAIANLVREAKNRSYFDRVFLVTPTYKSNKSIWDIAGIEEDDVYEPSVTALKTIQGLVEAEKEEWDSFLSKKENYKKFSKEIKDRPVSKVDPEQLLLFYELGFLDGHAPEWKYKNEVPPRLAVIIDDSMGTDLMTRRTAGLTNFCIKHRHIGDGLGISVFMLVQSYCSRDGVPRPVRENTTHLMLFRVNDESQLKKVREECDLPISDESWLNITHDAHSKPYNFLFIDFAPKCSTKRFRSGFDEYYNLPELVCECKK